MLANRQIISFDSIRIDDMTHWRIMQCGTNLFFGAIDNACGHIDHATALTFFDHNGIAQIRWWIFARGGKQPA